MVTFIDAIGKIGYVCCFKKCLYKAKVIYLKKSIVVKSRKSIMYSAKKIFSFSIYITFICFSVLSFSVVEEWFTKMNVLANSV